MSSNYLLYTLSSDHVQLLHGVLQGGRAGFDDLAGLDSTLHANLLAVKACQPEQVEHLGLTFAAEQRLFGKVMMHNIRRETWPLDCYYGAAIHGCKHVLQKLGIASGKLLFTWSSTQCGQQQVTAKDCVPKLLRPVHHYCVVTLSYMTVISAAYGD